MKEINLSFLSIGQSQFLDIAFMGLCFAKTQARTKRAQEARHVNNFNMQVQGAFSKEEFVQYSEGKGPF